MTAGKVWRMAKRSDIQSFPNLAAEFEELRELIEELHTNDLASGSIAAVLAWLGKPGQDDKNWGTLWGRRQHLVHGKMRLMQLLLSVMKLEREAKEKAELQNVLDQRSQDRVRTVLPPIIADMKARIGVSAKGLELVAATIARLLFYSVEAKAPRPPAAPSPAASACARGCPPGRCARQLDSARPPPAAAHGGAASEV
ncbi:hypothetical protein T492DRAFT_850350 [Pavlovales sp. CCMP2436]|nr:hypothetical protein T492DRAFT_850350 [Pavlovales sp. CCMP2436]